MLFDGDSSTKILHGFATVHLTQRPGASACGCLEAVTFEVGDPRAKKRGVQLRDSGMVGWWDGGPYSKLFRGFVLGGVFVFFAVI